MLSELYQWPHSVKNIHTSVYRLTPKYIALSMSSACRTVLSQEDMFPSGFVTKWKRNWICFQSLMREGSVLYIEQLMANECKRN